MDIGKAFGYVFEDEEWITKILVGALFVLASAVLIGIPFVVGYMIATMRNVMKGMEKPLPAWDNLGEKFKDGLIVVIIMLIWGAPIWILACLQGILAAALGNSSDAASTLGILSTCLSCVYLVWAIIVGLFSPAILIRYAETGEFAAGFEFSRLWQFTKENIGNVIIALLLGWVASIIGGFGVILCVVGVLATNFWAYLVTAHLYGQVYVNRAGQLPEPEPVATEE